MTTEATLLMQFRDRMMPYAGQSGAELQATVLKHGLDIVKQLQSNHGHALADAVSLLRAVLKDLQIKTI